MISVGQQVMRAQALGDISGNLMDVTTRDGLRRCDAKAHRKT